MIFDIVHIYTYFGIYGGWYIMFKRTLALVIALLVVCTGTAFAGNQISYTSSNGNIEITVSTLSSGEETTLLVAKGDISIASAFEDTRNILFVDQTNANSSGEAVFNVKYSGTDSITVYSGYASMSDTEEPFEKLVDLSNPDGSGGSLLYGDVNNDGVIDIIDASAVIEYFLNASSFTDSDGEEYEHGEDAADVNGDGSIDVVDASAIIEYFLNGTEFSVNK